MKTYYLYHNTNGRAVLGDTFTDKSGTLIRVIEADSWIKARDTFNPDLEFNQKWGYGYF